MSKTQTPVAAAIEAAFRLVVRGNNADGKRIRRVKNVMAPDMVIASERGAVLAEEVCADLTNPYFTVYPPVGELCKGGLSKGYEMQGNLVVKVGKPAVTVDATPPAAADAPPAAKKVRKAKAVVEEAKAA